MRREMWTALVAGVLCIVSIWGGLAAVGQADLPFAASPAPAEQDPDAALTEGSASQGQFQAVRTLSIDHGSRVNFWIRNNGAVPVEITIQAQRDISRLTSIFPAGTIRSGRGLRRTAERLISTTRSHSGHRKM